LIQEVKASERALFLISHCIGEAFVSSVEVSNILCCSTKTARRLMRMVYDYQNILGFYWAELEDDDNEKTPMKIMIRLDRKYYE